MPTQLQIDAEDDAALTEMETERLAEILFSTSDEAADIAAILSGPQNKIVRACITEWDEIGDDATRLGGNGSGLDYNPERNREVIRNILWRIIKGTGITIESWEIPTLFTVAGPSSCCY